MSPTRGVAVGMDAPLCSVSPYSHTTHPHPRGIKNRCSGYPELIYSKDYGIDGESSCDKGSAKERLVSIGNKYDDSAADDDGNDVTTGYSDDNEEIFYDNNVDE
ncbi:unnamed protein product [Rotaria socialis]|uniref:Uncharacterized protein n=1 Tax=Rotaria socialis TaxID=392032 RepID=A0A818RBE5_9BILA|nr:unnamed protein product [Rotaria socialis]CAF4925650.1 unnamed protein product [Rotaria socialis]